MKACSLFEAVDRALEMGQSAQSDRARGQISLFESAGMQPQVVDDRSLPDTAEWTERERLAHEKDMLGFYLSGHPLARYRTDLEEMGMRSAGELEGLPDGKGEVRREFSHEQGTTGDSQFKGEQ